MLISIHVCISSARERSGYATRTNYLSLLINGSIIPFRGLGRCVVSCCSMRPETVRESNATKWSSKNTARSNNRFVIRKFIAERL